MNKCDEARPEKYLPSSQKNILTSEAFDALQNMPSSFSKFPFLVVDVSSRYVKQKSFASDLPPRCFKDTFATKRQLQPFSPSVLSLVIYLSISQRNCQ
jgi:hypothetical protein